MPTWHGPLESGVKLLLCPSRAVGVFSDVELPPSDVLRRELPLETVRKGVRVVLGGVNLVATPGPKRAERCPVGPFFEHLWDFSDSFLTAFCEVGVLRLRYYSTVLVLRGATPDTVVFDLPVYDLHQVGHAAVVHVPYALVEPGVDIPVVLKGVEVQVLVAHRHRDVGGELSLLDQRQEVIEGVPVAADLGPWRIPSAKKGSSLSTNPSELSTGAENSKEMSLAGPCPTFWTIRLMLGRLA
jgi:hypothetical protein